MGPHSKLLKALKCPVGKERIGWAEEGESICLFCPDCKFVYTFDGAGKAIKSVKLVPCKKSEPCGCGRCGR